MVYELSENYIPQNFPHRTDQINKIQKVLDNFNKFSYGQNLLIQGLTGSGKTSIVKKVLNDFGKYYYVNTTSLYTTFKILKYLNNGGVPNDGIGILNGRFQEKLKNNPMPIVIDETNRIRDLENFMNCINSMYRTIQVPFIIITNKLTFLREIPDDARHTLFMEVVKFPSYNANELYDILVDRINLVRNQIPEIEERTLKLICALASKEGDARTAIRIIGKCIYDNNFNDEYIYNKYNEMQQEDWIYWINNMGISEKAFLEVFLDLVLVKQNINSLDIWNNMKQYTPARISQLITVFENYGIIKSVYQSVSGKRGRGYRVVSFVNDEIKNKIDKILMESKI